MRRSDYRTVAARGRRAICAPRHSTTPAQRCDRVVYRPRSQALRLRLIAEWNAGPACTFLVHRSTSLLGRSTAGGELTMEAHGSLSAYQRRRRLGPVHSERCDDRASYGSSAEPHVEQANYPPVVLGQIAIVARCFSVECYGQRKISICPAEPDERSALSVVCFTGHIIVGNAALTLRPRLPVDRKARVTSSSDRGSREPM